MKVKPYFLENIQKKKKKKKKIKISSAALVISAPRVNCFHLLFRYSTLYTMYPVFSLVLDKDVKPETALMYPELYKDLTKVIVTNHYDKALL